MQAQAATYYVDVTNGSDSNNGTSEDNTWKTISKVNSSSFNPGDSVLFKRGEEWWETLIVPSSGTSGNPITFGAYGTGDKPKIYSSDSHRYNHRSLDEYDKSGCGHNWNKCWSLNGDFEHYTGNTFDSWSPTVTGASTITVDATSYYSGSVSAKLTPAGGGYARLGETFYLAPNQKYEVSFWAKSDGVGSATTRFYKTTNGLANIKTGEIYQTWTGQQSISDLAVNVSDTTWTEKKIIIQVDNADRASTFQITTASASGNVWIDKVRVRPLWVNYSGDIWSAPYEGIQTGTLWLVSFNGILSKGTANPDSINADTKFATISFNTHEVVLYVYSPNGDPISSSENIELVTNSGSKTIDLNYKNYITIENLDIRNGYIGIRNGGTNVIINNSNIQTAIENIYINTGSNFTIQNSTITYGDWMINIAGGVDNVLIKNNVISGAMKLGMGEGGCIAPSTTSGKITNLIIEDNTIHNCESYGIAEYGTDVNNRIENAIYRRNHIYDVFYGFWTMSMANGVYNSSVYNNIFHSPKSGTSYGFRMYRLGNSVNFFNNTISDFTYGYYMWNGVNSAILKNNIIYNSQAFNISDSGNNSSSLNYNLYHSGGSNLFGFHGDNTLNFAGWKATSSQDTNSLSQDPIFINSSGSYSASSDFQLQWNSPAIDTGTDVGLTTDYAGNNIYGTPDIGAYEYQPPYTMGTDRVNTTGNIRIYGDGKYRYTSATTTASTANISVSPTTGDRSQWIDANINNWNTSGDYYKKWTETSNGSDLNTAHTVGDLAPRGYYTVWYTKEGSIRTELTRQIANDGGQISFTYTGGYSSVTFEIESISPDGGGLPPEAYNSPIPPVNGFSVVINNNNKETSSSVVTLILNAGPNTSEMAISNINDFRDAQREPYQATKNWVLNDGDGAKNVYAKFYTQWGHFSQIVSDSINLKTAGKKTASQIKQTPTKQQREKIIKLQKELIKLLKQLIDLLRNKR